MTENVFFTGLTPDQINNKDCFFQLGYQVFGPALTIFIHNIMEAQSHEVDGIYFIARDGYVLKKIFEILRTGIYGDKLNMFPPGKYMCISRIPIRSASLENFGINEINSCILESNHKWVTLRTAMLSYGLEPSEFKEICRQHDVEIDDRIYDLTQKSNLYPLLSSVEFRGIVHSTALAAKMMLRQYLINIDFIGSHNVAYVDIQGHGLSPWSLNRIFMNDDMGYPFVKSYYFALCSGGYNVDISQAKGIVYDFRIEPNHEKSSLQIFATLLETLTHPNHGVTIGYKKVRNDKIVPVFRKTPMEAQYILRERILNGIMSYAREYSKYYSVHNYDCSELLKYEKIMIRKWISYPPKNDVFLIKDIIVANPDPREKNEPLLDELKCSDFIKPTIFLKKLETSVWPQGLLTLGPFAELTRLFYTSMTNNKVCRKMLSSILKKLK